MYKKNTYHIKYKSFLQIIKYFILDKIFEINYSINLIIVF